MSIQTQTLADHVAEALPQGGPYSIERTETAALILPELVNYLNRATFDDRDAATALPYPSTTSSVIASVKTLTERLQQLLGQLADREDQHAADPSLQAYGSETTAAVLAGVIAVDLRAAAQLTGDLAARLDKVHNDAASLSVPSPSTTRTRTTSDDERYGRRGGRRPGRAGDRGADRGGALPDTSEGTPGRRATPCRTHLHRPR